MLRSQILGTFRGQHLNDTHFVQKSQVLFSLILLEVSDILSLKHSADINLVDEETENDFEENFKIF